MKQFIFIILLCCISALDANTQNIPSIQLKNSEFNSSIFKPTTYTSIDNSSSIAKLQESLYQREQQLYSVGDKYVSFCKFLGEIHSLLYPDTDLQLWYNEYKKEMFSDIEANYQIGNYQKTSRLIDQRINSISSDPKLLYRIDASNKYKAFKSQISNKFRGGLTYQWWIETHPFVYKEYFNRNGQLIGYTGTNLEPLADEFKWLEHIKYVRNHILRGKKFTSYVGGDLFDNFSSSIDGFNKSVAQSYMVEVWFYNNELSTQSYDSNRMKRQKELLFNNGQLITPREYYIRRLSLFLK